LVPHLPQGFRVEIRANINNRLHSPQKFAKIWSRISVTILAPSHLQNGSHALLEMLGQAEAFQIQDINVLVELDFTLQRFL
jgi:hypothetical protein